MFPAAACVLGEGPVLAAAVRGPWQHCCCCSHNLLHQHCWQVLQQEGADQMALGAVAIHHPQQQLTTAAEVVHDQAPAGNNHHTLIVRVGDLFTTPSS